MGEMERADFVVLTALDEERDAVLNLLPACSPAMPSDDDARVYWCSSVAIKAPNGAEGRYDIVVTSLPGMGRVEAANATNDAIRRWSPRYVILVGIAGGFSGEGVKHGDVLISDQIVDYELQKVHENGPSVRYNVHRADTRLLNAAKNFPDSSWRSRDGVKRPRRGTPRRHIGPIATGDKVVAFRPFMDQHGQAWPKLIGVEMEAGGAAAAAFQAVSRPGFFMVRGVSDLADENKEASASKMWRRYACAIPASFLVDLLKSGPVPFVAHRREVAMDEPLEIELSSSSEDGVIVEARKRTSDIELTIPDRKPSDWRPEEREALLRAIDDLLNISGVVIKTVRDGSTIITLELTPEQAERLLWAVRAGELAEFGVHFARIVEGPQDLSPGLLMEEISAGKAVAACHPSEKDDIDPCERRQRRREAIRCDLWMVDHGGATVLRCRCEDVSEGGMRLRVPLGYGVTEGQRFELRSALSDADSCDALGMAGRRWVTVVRTRTHLGGGENHLEVGVAFDPPDPFNPWEAQRGEASPKAPPAKRDQAGPRLPQAAPPQSEPKPPIEQS